MNQLALLLFFPVLLSQIDLKPTVAPPAEELPWSDDRRLSWDDFKGVPAGKRLTGAITYATIKATPKVTGYFNNRVEVEVKAIFRCDKSWAKAKARESEYLLNHEQRHFDIAEMYARKIREALRGHRITPRNYNAVKKEVIQPLFKAYVAYDESYDHLTVHGLNTEAQQEWNELIDAELGLLQPDLSNE